jgi:hypothetical protein
MSGDMVCVGYENCREMVGVGCGMCMEMLGVGRGNWERWKVWVVGIVGNVFVEIQAFNTLRTWHLNCLTFWYRNLAFKL